MPHVTHRIAGRGSRLALALVGALCALAVAAQPSHAGLLVKSAPNCQAPATTKPFRPWLDLASYTQAPDGGFEAGAKGWALDDGAAPVTGNEPYKVGAAGDSTALRIPAGGDATSPTFCVGVEHPTVRLKFVPMGAGSWTVDDVYVDPFKHF